MSSLLLKSDLVVTLDPDDRILKEGYILLEDGHIIEMGLQKDVNGVAVGGSQQERSILDDFHPFSIDGHKHTGRRSMLNPFMKFPVCF